MKKLISAKPLFFCFVLLLSSTTLKAQKEKTFSLTSPDKQTELKINLGSTISYEVKYKNERILLPSAISMNIDNRVVLGEKFRFRTSSQRAVNETLSPVFGKFKTIKNNFNEIRIDFRENYSLEFRVYNEGLAYRFITRFPGEIKVYDEKSEYNLPMDPIAWLPIPKSFRAEYEVNYENGPLSGFSDTTMAFTPLVLGYPNNIKVVLTESALLDYPGMYLKVNSGNNAPVLSGLWPQYPLEVTKGNPSYNILKRADYLAITNGNRTFPWRIMILSDKDEDLLTNEMVYLLAEPNRLDETSWIKPGKVAWEWWYARNLSGVDFVTGVNTETYRYYIDFASKNNLEYILIDGGWFADNDLSKMKPEIDIPGLVQYGKQKNVDVILWVRHNLFYPEMNRFLDLYKSWGIAGLKVDFLERDDQLGVRFFEDIGAAAAKRKMVINFHGCPKPAGIHRTYPNILTFEAVLGAEYSKWSDRAHPDHNALIPFLRMLSGPMDYTPGAMRNATKDNFRIVHSEPMGQGTRCHQLAMYIVFDSYMAMISDAPTSYEKEPHMLDFFANLETVWDTTVIVGAKLGEYIITAKKNKDVWHVAALNNWTEREIDLDFSFLPTGKYKVKLYKDGINANKVARDYKVEDILLNSGSRMKIKLASGGGMVMRIKSE